MSNNPGNSNIMYTSTPLRKNAHYSCGSYQRGFADEEEITEAGYNQKFYSIPQYNNTTNVSDNNQYQSIPAETYISTLPELLNENELELVIESDTEESYTHYNTPDTSYQKRNICHPLCFQNACSIYNEENNNENDTDTAYTDIPFSVRDNDTGYTDIPLNVRETHTGYTDIPLNIREVDTAYTDIPLNVREKYYQLSTSSAAYTNDTTPNYSNGVKVRQEYIESEEDDSECSESNIPNVCHNCNKPWNSNYSQEDSYKKCGKPHISMETYPSSIQYTKKNRRTPNSTVPFIKEDDYQQQLPSFFHNSDATYPSKITSYTGEETLDPIYLKYSKKEDIAAKSDSINMLSVVISTVMLMASKSQIPQNYITWTLKYLKCIKDKQGQHPPNIQKIQKMLTEGTSTSGTGQWQSMEFVPGTNLCNRMDSTEKRRK